jgi:hypothetical protein
MAQAVYAHMNKWIKKKYKKNKKERKEKEAKTGLSKIKHHCLYLECNALN